jgi:hypothetical protein
MTVQSMTLCEFENLCYNKKHHIVTESDQS